MKFTGIINGENPIAICLLNPHPIATSLRKANNVQQVFYISKVDREYA